jgi:hypothetical protein
MCPRFPRLILKGMEPSLERPGREWGGADTHHPPDNNGRQSAPSPQGRRPGEILQGRGAKALEESVPEVAPASSCWDGAVPGAAGEGMGRCGSPPP